MVELKKRQLEMSNMLIQTVICICISEIGGIRTLPPRLIGKFYSLLSRDQENNAVISYDLQNKMTIDIFIEVEYNQCIPDKVKELQQMIKHEIEVITGYTVKEVNVYVDGLWLRRDLNKKVRPCNDTSESPS